jgi:hypothetical protein
MIFKIYATEKHGSLQNVLLVCKEWYQVAEAITELWSGFNVTADEEWKQEGALGFIVCRTPEAVDLVLKRSKLRPVKLRLVIGMHDSRSSCEPQDRAVLFRHAIGQCASRLSYLSIDILLRRTFQEAEIVASLEGVFVIPMPKMNQLRIMPMNLDPDAFEELCRQICQSSHQLSRISLSGKVFEDLITYDFLQDADHPPLKSIEVHPSNAEHFGISLLAPVGETIQRLFIHDKLIMDLPGNVINLPQLKRFEVDFISMEALSVLLLPVLEEFIILEGLLVGEVQPRSSIHLPALRRMHIQNVVREISCIYAPSLERLSLHTELWNNKVISPIFRDIFDGSETSLRPSHLNLKLRSGSYIGHILPSLRKLTHLQILEVECDFPLHVFNRVFWRVLTVEEDGSQVLFPNLSRLFVYECLDPLRLKFATEMLMSRKSCSLCAPLTLMSLDR